MKENEIKTALLNEVIEMIKGNIKSGRLGEYEYRNNAYTRGLIKQVQSLLPKEEAIDGQIKEPVKSEPTQEIKAGDTIECEYDDNWVFGTYFGDSTQGKIVQLRNENICRFVQVIRKPIQKTQEKMDREKAREILNKWGLLDSEGKGNPEVVCAVLEAVGVKSGRETK